MFLICTFLRRFYDGPYGPSCTPLQLCRVLETSFEIFQMSHKIPYLERDRKMYEKASKTIRVE